MKSIKDDIFVDIPCMDATWQPYEWPHFFYFFWKRVHLKEFYILFYFLFFLFYFIIPIHFNLIFFREGKKYLKKFLFYLFISWGFDLIMGFKGNVFFFFFF